jgi:hypothetical protein
MDPFDDNEIRDWTPGEVYHAICRDFETAWDAVAATPPATPPAPNQGRGNFMFANQAMILLEWACRLCAGDPTSAALGTFSHCIETVRPHYFTPLPTKIKGTAAGGVRLPRPTRPMQPGHCPVLWLLFDLVRNGLAHQYQQIVLRPPDAPVYVSLAGPEFGHSIEQTRRRGPVRHLWHESKARALGLMVCPEWLYLDFKTAIDESNVLSLGLQPRSLKRPDSYGPYPGLTVKNLRAALDAAGHPNIRTADTAGTCTNVSQTTADSIQSVLGEPAC